jgi:ubiquinone/menaquinone biosynthesis C-methylase UbiE
MAKNYDKRTLKAYQKAYSDTICKSKNYLDPSYIAMDIGCGSGITTIELAKEVKNIYALDTSQKMIDVAKEKAENSTVSNIRFFVADIFDTRWEKNCCDVVMAYNILSYIEDVDSFLIRIYEMLKPGGIFLSATDCYGEKKSAITCIQFLLCKLKVIPFTENFSIREIESTIQKNNFHILESCNLHDKLPNLFIAAKK